ncbi:hypothetical protein BH10ACT1_BH10ACT1_42970 [soil metagenome]
MFDQARATLARYREAELRPALELDEVILAVGPVQSAFIGRDDIETAPGPLEEAMRYALARVDDLPPVPKGFLAVVGIAAVVTDPGALVSLPIDPDRMLGGWVGHGGIGSVAAVCKAALATSRATTLVVTDRRLAIAADSDVKRRVDGLDQEVAAAELLASVPRSVVLGVRRRRRPLEWGRIELAFVDGSSITVTAGTLSGRRANQLVAALTS